MSDSQTPAGTGDPVSSKAARYALVMLTIVYAFNFIDRQILVILQEQIKADMGLSDAQLGLLSGFSFALVYVIAGIPIAYWADRINRRNIIAISLTIWSGMTAISGLAQNYSHLLMARIGVGIGEAGGSPPGHSMLSDYFPPERRGMAMGIYSTGLHFGILVGFLLGGFISQAFGWRIAFMVVGLPGVLFALLFFLTVQEPVRGRWESQAAAAYKPGLKETMNVLAGYRSFWYISMACAMTAFAGYGMANFAPSFLIRSHDLSVAEVGVVLALFGGGAGMAGTFLGGMISDRLGRKDKRWYLWYPALAGCVALPMMFPYLLLSNTNLAIFFMFFATMFSNSYIGSALAVSHGLVPPAMRALTSSVLFFVLNLIGLGLGPLTAGLLSDYFTGLYGSDGLRYALLCVGLLGTPGILFFYLASRHLHADMARNHFEESPAS